MPYYTLSDWRNKCKTEMKQPKLPETEKENAELKTANEILKDAPAEQYPQEKFP